MMPPVVTFSLRGSSPIGNQYEQEIFVSLAIYLSIAS